MVRRILQSIMKGKGSAEQQSERSRRLSSAHDEWSFFQESFDQEIFMPAEQEQPRSPLPAEAPIQEEIFISDSEPSQKQRKSSGKKQAKPNSSAKKRAAEKEPL